MEERTGITTTTADDAMTCVAIGTGKYVEFLGGDRSNL
jgi:rod shape-determining protein MreB